MIKKESGEDSANVRLDDREQALLTLLGRCEPVSKVAQSTGVSVRALAGVLRSVKIALEANDSATDDFLALVENWGQVEPERFMFPLSNGDEEHVMGEQVQNDLQGGSDRSGMAKDKQAIINQIESEWSPFQMRDLGASLMRLADAMDQNWDPANVQATFRWPSSAARIERNSLTLAKKAILLKQQIKMRNKFLPKALLGEPA
jgi:hypothetical protein